MNIKREYWSCPQVPRLETFPKYLTEILPYIIRTNLGTPGDLGTRLQTRRVDVAPGRPQADPGAETWDQTSDRAVPPRPTLRYRGKPSASIVGLWVPLALASTSPSWPGDPSPLEGATPCFPGVFEGAGSIRVCDPKLATGNATICEVAWGTAPRSGQESPGARLFEGPLFEGVVKP